MIRAAGDEEKIPAGMPADPYAMVVECNISFMHYKDLKKSIKNIVRNWYFVQKP